LVDWFEVTEEIAITWPDPIAVYAASKAIAEKSLWAFAKEHPELNIVTRMFTWRHLQCFGD
jgi:nucleoside-diphosphate-sugar epimerase